VGLPGDGIAPHPIDPSPDLGSIRISREALLSLQTSLKSQHQQIVADQQTVAHIKSELAQRINGEPSEAVAGSGVTVMALSFRYLWQGTALRPGSYASAITPEGAATNTIGLLLGTWYTTVGSGEVVNYEFKRHEMMKQCARLEDAMRDRRAFVEKAEKLVEEKLGSSSTGP
jgi:hypothetical protein